MARGTWLLPGPSPYCRLVMFQGDYGSRLTTWICWEDFKMNI